MNSEYSSPQLRHYCTCFDRNYVPRGLALLRSMRAHCGDFVLWVLCLDSQAYEEMARSAFPEVRLISLEEFIANDAPLRAAQHDRSRVEFYFTCTPSLPLYVLEHDDEVDTITYLDADLFFFSSPEPVFAEIGSAPIAITPHRYFVRGLAGMYGKYNVGWLTFRRSKEGLDCLRWWREQCLVWCGDHPWEGKFADQKYLDQSKTLFPGTHSIAHVGVNLAPWNLENYVVERNGKGLAVDGVPVVCFHFSRIGRMLYFWIDYGGSGWHFTMTRCIEQEIYLPYLDVVGHDLRSVREPFQSRSLLRNVRRIRRQVMSLLRGEGRFISLPPIGAGHRWRFQGNRR